LEGEKVAISIKKEISVVINKKISVATNATKANIYKGKELT
jgi:hypothetical protein